jgi:hypothetical protein
MLGKKLLWSAIALGFLTNAGCCGFWDRWCNRPNHCQAAPYCPQACPPGCAPTPSYSSPGGVVPVPNAPNGTTWQRCP